MSEPKTYEIRTVADFLQVPPERRALCVKEFGDWLSVTDAIAMTNEIMKPFGVGIEDVGGDVYRWVDDDKGEVTVRFHGPTGPVGTFTYNPEN